MLQSVRSFEKHRNTVGVVLAKRESLVSNSSLMKSPLFMAASCCAMLFSALAPMHAAQSSAPRERMPLNSDWLFQKGDPVGSTNELNYFKGPGVKEAVLASTTPAGLTLEQRKLGAGLAYSQVGLDDSFWRKLNLPHDWAIEGPFDIKLPGEAGKLPHEGVGWYRKHFTIPASDAGKQITLEMDGAMSYAMVWCNGQFVGGWPYGYSSFRFDLTPYLKIGGENILAVRLDNPKQSSRWYPGAGIYRNVWLVKNYPVHIAHWGTYLTTPEVSEGGAKVDLKVSLENHTTKDASVTVKTELKRAGLTIGTIDGGTVTVPAGGNAISNGTATVTSPKLWSVETPELYTAVTTVSQDGNVLDCYETPFGIRTIQFTPDNGFLLNGKRVQLKGVCNHHDLGALGTAFNTRAAERQLQMLKEMGFNALRTSHNPPAPELLDLCDRMGILVMDESFDCWKKGKKEGDYHNLWDDWHEKDLRAEIRRDRNHPSIIFWSIGNEVIELRDATNGPVIAAELTKIAKEEDPTRLTVLGSNAGDASYNGIQKAVGVMGQNYEFGGYGKFRKENPEKPLVGSETSSAVSSRGEYFFDTPEEFEARYAEQVAMAQTKGKPVPPKPGFSPVSEDKNSGKASFQVSSFDLYGPGWAWVPDKEFASLEQNSHVAGEFVWTGFDYLGEPTPYNGDREILNNFRNDPVLRAQAEKEIKELGRIQTPSRSSYFGIIDLAGFKKDRFYLYQAHWRPDFPMAHILPHWNWPDRVGQVTPVHVYTSGDEVELFLNGKSLGKKKKGPTDYRLRWDDVVYQPGELKVIAYKDGKEWAQDVVITTGAPAKLLIKADRSEIKANGKDLSFVTVTVADKDGLMVPRSKSLITFEISGPGEIVAVDNGDATSLEPFQSHQTKAFNGLALVIVKAKEGGSGSITLKATSEGLSPAETVITGK